MITIEKVKSKIASADFSDAIQALKPLAKGSPIADDVLQLEARFNHNEQANRHGTLSVAEYTLERNRISKALLGVCSELEKGQKSTQMPQNVSSNFSEPTGYCIRTGKPIPFNINKPFCKEAYDIWAQFENEEYPEKFCHFSGEPSNEETNFGYPVLKSIGSEQKRCIVFKEHKSNLCCNAQRPARRKLILKNLCYFGNATIHK